MGGTNADKSGVCCGFGGKGVGGGVRGWALSKRAGGLPMLARSVAPAGTSKICGRLDDHRRGQRVRAEEPALPGLDVVAGRVHSLRFSEL